MTTARRWGQIIREQRTERGLSQYDVARMCEVRQGAVSMWERGERLPSRRNLARLCSELGLPVSVFDYRDDEQAA